MKNTLINLSANDINDGATEAIFRAMFNDDIIIAPNSEMALQSVSLNKRLELIQIDSNNDTIIFQIVGSTSIENGVVYGSQHEIHCKHGTFSKNNFLDLFSDIQNKMNSKIGVVSSKEFGMEILIGISSNEKISFQFEKTNNVTFKTPTTNTAITNKTCKEQSINGRSVIVINGTPSPVETHYMYSNTNFSRGCGQFSTRIELFNNANGGVPAGFVMGLIEDTQEHRDKLNNNTISFTDFTYGIATNNSMLSANNYLVKTTHDTSIHHDGFVEGSTPLPVVQTGAGDEANNDVLFIRLNKGKIELGKYDNTGGGRILVGESLDYDFGNESGHKEYIPFICILGNSTTTKLSSIKTSITPYNSNTTSDDFELDVGFGAIPQTTSARSTFKLNFQTQTLSDFFGFTQLSNTAINISQTFIANKTFSKHIGTNTYLIEMLNPVSLDSYHSFSKGRKSILASIPISERIINGAGQIQYEPNTLFYVSMNNKFPINLRNISCRIIANDFSVIQTDGISEIAILIKEIE